MYALETSENSKFAPTGAKFAGRLALLNLQSRVYQKEGISTVSPQGYMGFITFYLNLNFFICI